jgi:hypothetical protein
MSGVMFASKDSLVEDDQVRFAVALLGFVLRARAAPASLDAPR